MSEAKAQRGVVTGEGKVIRKDGTVVEFTLTSDPLTEEQAKALNIPTEESTDGSNTPNSSP